MRILSGMRPSGKLHIGHLSVLSNWLKLQENSECFFFVADWHALTTAFDETGPIINNTKEMLADWLAVGIDPERSTIFVQSKILQHAELHLLLSMVTPVSWLERVPTYKDQIQQLAELGKDIATYGFLGYPLLQAADILIYRADAVPVGQDQLPHLELCREVARRFNHLYAPVLVEPKELLGQDALLPGTDGRKMSKSYANEISLAADADTVTQKVRQMVTDPNRIRKNDPGNPEICDVFTYHKIYNTVSSEEIASLCRQGLIGCVECKLQMAEKLNAYLAPIRKRRKQILADPAYLENVLAKGQAKAQSAAGETMQMVREAMHIG